MTSNLLSAPMELSDTELDAVAAGCGCGCQPTLAVDVNAQVCGIAQLSIGATV